MRRGDMPHNISSYWHAGPDDTNERFKGPVLVAYVLQSWVLRTHSEPGPARSLNYVFILHFADADLM